MHRRYLYFVPHQANLRINSATAEILGLKESQVFNTISEYGNTTAATIPIGLSRAIGEERIKTRRFGTKCCFW